MGLLDFIGGGGGGGGGSIQSMWGGAPSLGQTAFNIYQNQQASWQADHAMDRSETMAREEMAFQERMSNTSYQRATEDMKKAGINPMVAFQQGGASTPQGAMGQAFQAPVKNILEGALSSALDVVRLKKDLDQADSGIALNQANATNALAQAKSAGSSAKMTDTSQKSLESQLKAIGLEAEARAKKAGYDSKAAGYDAIMSRANRDSGTAKNVLDAIKPFGQQQPKFNSNKYFWGNKSTGEVFDTPYQP